MIPDIPYRFTVRPLSGNDGGGYVVEFPDLPGCMSDGDTIEQAILNGVDAMRGWIVAMQTEGHPIPLPSQTSSDSRPIWEIAADIAKTVPDSAWRELPKDLATNYKNYLYGNRKATE